MKLSEKLLQEALKNIDLIVDPIEKVNAISKIINYVSVHDCELTVSETTKPHTAVKTEIEPIRLEVKTPAATVSEPSSADAPIDIPMPKDNETLEEAELRRNLIAEKYGSLTITEAFANPDIVQYLKPEIEGIKSLKKMIQSHFPKLTPSEIEETLKYYMLEPVPEISDYEKIPLNKFLMSFFPYAKDLYVIYQYTEAQVIDAVNAVSNGLYSNQGMKAVKVSNIKAIILCLQDLKYA